MYQFDRLLIIYCIAFSRAVFKRVALSHFFMINSWFFALPAFAFGQPTPHPYENTRFLATHSTLQQLSAHVLENVTLKSALKSLQTTTSVVIWLDRRNDCEQIVQLMPKERTYLECLQEICSQTNTEIAWIENIIYIAPAHQSSRIEAAYWNLITERGDELLRKKGKPLKWDDAKEVRDILQQASTSTLLKISGLDSVEHDMWAPAIVPEASLAAQWTCLLAGFNFTLKPNEQHRFQLIPIAKILNVSFEYSKELSRISPTRLQEWKQKWSSDSTISSRNQITKIEAPVAAHRELILAMQAPKAFPRNQAPGFEDSRYTLDFEGDLEKILTTLSKQLGLTIKPLPLPPEKAKQRIQLHVKEVSIDDLLKRLSEQSKLQFQRKNKVITIQE